MVASELMGPPAVVENEFAVAIAEKEEGPVQRAVADQSILSVVMDQSDSLTSEDMCRGTLVSEALDHIGHGSCGATPSLLLVCRQGHNHRAWTVEAVDTSV